MTLIVGVRGKDGIVLGSDQKVVRGGETQYTNKIHVLHGVAFAVELVLARSVPSHFRYLTFSSRQAEHFGREVGFPTQLEDKRRRPCVEQY